MRLHATGATRAWSGEPATVRNSDRPTRVAKALIEASARGPAMRTVVEQHCADLGRNQLLTLVGLLFDALASH
jgi:hypothetical protein